MSQKRAKKVGYNDAGDEAAPLPPKPLDMPWCAPYLVVADPAKALEFYSKAFGFEKRFAMTDPTGKIVHAEMQHKDAVIMFGPPNDDPGTGKTPAALGGTPVGMYVYVDDVDKLSSRAKRAGAKITQPPREEFWGDRTCRLHDPDGHAWVFASHVKPKERGEE